MKIYYEDDDLVVVEKPADVLSEPAAGKADILSLWAEKSGGTPFLVHRLDRNTGGAMVLAKTPLAASKLSAAIQRREFQKDYFAVIKGKPAEPEGVFEDLLFRDAAKNKSFVVKRERKGVKKAVLSYRVLDSLSTEGGEISLVSVRLHTGRTHQVRVQFASRKMPLLGDGKYGSRDNACETALWSAGLSFPHPKTGKTVAVKSLPPRNYPWTLFSEEKFLSTAEKEAR